MDDLKRLAAEAQDMAPALVAWRRDFHMHPELGFEEVRTAGVAADHLRSLRLEVSAWRRQDRRCRRRRRR